MAPLFLYYHKLVKKKGELKMNTEKGMLLFYDWVDALKCLNPEEMKKMLLAMVEYHRDGTPPPEFEGEGAKMISHFIFPQLRRMRESMDAKAKKKTYYKA